MKLELKESLLISNLSMRTYISKFIVCRKIDCKFFFDISWLFQCYFSFPSFFRRFFFLYYVFVIILLFMFCRFMFCHRPIWSGTTIFVRNASNISADDEIMCCDWRSKCESTAPPRFSLNARVKQLVNFFNQIINRPNLFSLAEENSQTTPRFE